MHRFAALLEDLEVDAGRGDAPALLAAWLAEATPADAAWGLHLLLGRPLPRPLKPARLHAWARQAAGLDDFLYEASRAACGRDAAELIGHVLPAGHGPDPGLAESIARWLLPLRGLDEAAQHACVTQAWSQLDGAARILFVRLQGFGWRSRVARRDLLAALSALAARPAPDSGPSPARLALRLAAWPTDPGRVEAGLWAALLNADGDAEEDALPYPPADGREGEPAMGGEDWRVETLPAGLLVQVLRRDGPVRVWGDGGELLEIQVPAAAGWPAGTVVEGVWVEAGAGGPVLHGLDLLEWDGQALLDQPLSARLDRLHAVAGRLGIRLPSALAGRDPAALSAARADAAAQGARGLLLRRLDAVARLHHRWPAEPWTVRATVLDLDIGLRPACTLALWTRPPSEGGELVPVARVALPADAGLRAALERESREQLVERFGPVRRLRARLVVEVGYERVRANARRRSGVELVGAVLGRLRPELGIDAVATLAGLAGRDHS